MNISVLGAGYVGLTTAACLAEIGHQVFCADTDGQKLELLNGGGLPFYEPNLGPIVAKNRKEGRLEFGSPETAVERGEVIFICVGTPPLDNGEADLSAIERVGRVIAQKCHGYRLVIEKSTVPVMTSRQLQKHLAIFNSNRLDYDIVSNPEFLREGSAVEDFFHPDRIVVGVESSRAAELMAAIYGPVLNQSFACPIHENCPSRTRVPFVVTDTNSAELVKHASNSFLAMKISFINMVADLCEKTGADIDRVAEGMGMDPRIGPAFLKPGIGFGGFCFPKDLQAFVNIADKFGCDFSLLKEVEKINLRRTEQFVEKVRQELWVLRNKKVAVWGLAFKPNTDDVRFAPALTIIKKLIAEGVQVQAYDPQAMEKAKAEIPNLTCCADIYETAKGAEAILILTEWKEFLEADWDKLWSLMDRPLVIDGRNMFSAHQLGRHQFQYVDIGRALRVPASPAVAEGANGRVPALK